MSAAETAEPIEMPFGIWTREGILISIGNIRVLFMISERKFKEMRVVVKFYEYYSIFCSIIPSIICEAGKEALRLRQYILYVYV